MTTSHKPTYHPAIGRVHAGGYRFDAKRAQYSSRDMARHMTLKVRNDLGGQNAAAMDKQLLREKLFEQENKHKQSIRDERARQGLLPADDDDDDAPRSAAAASAAAASDSAAAAAAAPAVDLSQFDDEDDDVAAAAAAAVHNKGGGGGESSSSDDDDSDDDDEDAELARELDLIRREREQARLKAAQAEAEAAEAAQAAQVKANPLMPLPSGAAAAAAPAFGADAAAAAAAVGGVAGVKRRWDDDVVFKNQAKGAMDNKPKKRFINDTIRSDFHRSFIRKYVQ